MTTPDQYIDAQAEPRRSELRELHALIRATVPDLEAEVDGGMIGYGKYHYRYASGREGDWYAVTLAANRASISLHVAGVNGDHYLAEERAARFPKAHVGRSCVRFKHTGDIDLAALRDLVRDGAAAVAAAR